MLIPQFSIRLLLAITTVAALVFLVLRQAVAGSSWAVGVSAGIGFVALGFAVYALLFLVSLVLVRFTSLARPKSQGVSPFATHRLPPQILPPTNPENE